MKHEVVDGKAWLEARKALLAKEKAFTRARDELTLARRALPWERVEKRYVFDGPDGEQTLAQLFDGRSQLVVYHFMFGPDAEAGCKACSFWADNFERNVIHLAQRDVTMLAISRAPLPKLLAFQKRFGWTFKWLSSGRSDFNFDYHVSFDPKRAPQTHNYAPKSDSNTEHAGVSVFYRDDNDAVFHTYSTYARGLDMLNAGYHYLDLVPKGRDEDGLPSTVSWLRHRDRYDVA